MPKIPNSAVGPNCIRVDLGRSLTTSVSDENWEVVDPAHIACWQSATTLLHSRSFEHEGDLVTLNVNWLPVIRRLERYHSIMRRLWQVKGTPAANEISFPQTSVRVDFNATINGSQDINANLLQHFAEYFLYDVFLIMNIAAPGSCDFYSAKFPSDKFSNKISLSNMSFEVALMRSDRGNWPKIEFLSLEQVIKWFFSVRAELRLMPRNRMERVLFAVLHLSKIDASPVSIVWIFYALETLFDTKAGENLRALISRIELVLRPDKDQLGRLKKRMRELYDLRSSFVHGGLDVIHPIHNEILDRSVDIAFYRLMEAVDFGFQILLASLQEVIRRGWCEPSFKEILEGHSGATP